MPIIGRSHQNGFIIDAFAGPGEYTDGDSGSPVLSWNQATQHHDHKNWQARLNFQFIENDHARAEHLRKVMSTQPSHQGLHYEVWQDDADNKLTSLLQTCRATNSPVFVMLDPFGIKGVTYDVLKEILTTPSGEFMLSFMASTANRFGGTPQVHEHLKKLINTDQVAEHSVEGYCDALEQTIRQAGAQHVLRFALYDGNTYAYTLFFATKHQLGCSRMKDAMWKVAGGGTYQFNGLKKNQPLLLSEENFGYAELTKELTDHFGFNNWVPVEKIDDFMHSDKTHFRHSDLRSKALAPMQRENKLEANNRQPRRGTFPADRGIQVRFLP